MTDEKILGIYKNGNYKVLIGDHGTKIRYNGFNNFQPEFPESIDCKISDRCDKNCPMCHECSTPNGALADLNHPLFNSLKPYTELALGGGNVLEHPDLEAFLRRMKQQNVICNITVHVDHFVQNYIRLKNMKAEGLFHGLGVSVNRDIIPDVARALSAFPDAVAHVIAGVVPMEALYRLGAQNVKLLILGYKNFGRGQTYYKKLSPSIEFKIAALENALFKGNLKTLFAAVSFDNLALEQLHIKKHMPKEDWDLSYLGEDGQFTMYLDMVKQEYAVSSVSERKLIFSHDICKLFAEVRKETEDADK